MKRYIIKAGKHFSMHGIGIHFGDQKRTYRFKIDPECYYPIMDNEDLAVNKLFGWSFGFHHRNSIRLGWRPGMTANQIMLFAYIYNNGVRSIHSLTIILTGHEYEVTIAVHDMFRNVWFSVQEVGNPAGMRQSLNRVPFVMPRFKWGYNLYFYAGGTRPARRDWFAWFQRIK